MASLFQNIQKQISRGQLLKNFGQFQTPFLKINETKFGKNEPPVSTKIVVVNCLQLNPVPMTPLGPFSYMIPQLLATTD